MAGFIFTKPLLVAATVVLLIPGYLGEGSAAPGTAPQYCGLTPATDQTNFPLYVDYVLQDLVKNTQEQIADATSDETKYTSTDPVDGDIGAATGNAICYRGVTGDSCGTCLQYAAQYVSPCRTLTTGGAYYDQQCFLQFRQL